MDLINVWRGYGQTDQVQIVTMDEAFDLMTDPWFIVWISPGIDVLLCDYCRRNNNFLLRPEAERCEHCGADLSEGYRLLGKAPAGHIVFVKMYSGGPDGI